MKIDFIDTPDAYLITTARSRNQKVTSVGSKSVAILRSARSSFARHIQVAHTEMNAQLDNNPVPGLGNNDYRRLFTEP